MALYYVSFASPAGWQGAAFVDAPSVVEATTQADEKGINPGGNEIQVLTFRYDGLADVPKVPASMRGRRLGAQELLEFWPDAKDIMDYEDHV